MSRAIVGLRPPKPPCNSRGLFPSNLCNSRGLRPHGLCETRELRPPDPLRNQGAPPPGPSGELFHQWIDWQFIDTEIYPLQWIALAIHLHGNSPYASPYLGILEVLDVWISCVWRLGFLNCWTLECWSGDQNEHKNILKIKTSKKQTVKNQLESKI